MLYGLLSVPWWGGVIITLVLTHITIISVTVYLHRNQAHRSLDLHPVVSHFFRLWLWLTTGMVTKEWVAVHRKHHAKCETEEDPHSPQFKGIHKVLWEGAELYRAEVKNRETIEAYGHGAPDDWLERNVYTKYNFLGVSFLVVLDTLLFGVYGVTMWAVQMLWIPFFAAGVINGLSHYWGYRNFETPDGSTNLVNMGILIGGEEMHNNHHAFPSSAKFSNKWWEFDLGWLYIRLLAVLRLARIRRLAPKPVLLRDKSKIDMDTLRAIIPSRMHVMAQYAKRVTLPVLKEQVKGAADASYRRLLKQVRKALIRDESRIDEKEKSRLQCVLDQSETLKTVYEFRRRLQALWGRTYNTHEKLLQALQDWCQQADAADLPVLKEFAQCLRRYSLHHVPVGA
jgi:stearoyl-CoA desaturase (delta-9 desaturase)